MPTEVTHEDETYTVTELLQGAFWNCTSLTSVKLPESLTTIREGAFHNCAELAEVLVPDAVAEIGANAFAYCPRLHVVAFPAACHSFADGLFANSGNEVDELVVTGTGGVTTVGYQTFFRANLHAFPGSDALSYVGLQAFAQSSLESFGTAEYAASAVALTIENTAFSGCTSLKTIYLPAAVDVEFPDAFDDCPALQLIGLGAVIPPALSRDWAAEVAADCVLEVPEEAESAYRAAEYWKNFTTIRALTPAGVDSMADSQLKVMAEAGAICVEGCGLVSVSDISGRSIYVGESGRIEVPAGLYIVTTRAGVAKVLVR